MYNKNFLKMLNILVLIPFLGSIILVVIPLNNNNGKIFSLFISIIAIWITLYIYSTIDLSINIFIDNSNNKSIINRENGIYKVYDNLFLNAGNVPNYHDPNNKMIDKFTFNLTEVLEDLYDNNESTVFNLYFIIKKLKYKYFYIFDLN